MIHLSYKIEVNNPKDQDSYEKFAACWRLITAPKSSFVSWGGKNPCSLQFDTPSLDQKERGVVGRYKGRQITIYEEEPTLRILIHEYAHHLQALNCADANPGWYGGFQNKKQDELFFKWQGELPGWTYARTSPSEMAAEAFTFCHGYPPLGWRVPKGFLKDWFVFFFTQEYFQYTFKWCQGR